MFDVTRDRWGVLDLEFSLIWKLMLEPIEAKLELRGKLHTPWFHIEGALKIVKILKSTFLQRNHPKIISGSRANFTEIIVNNN